MMIISLIDRPLARSIRAKSFRSWADGARPFVHSDPASERSRISSGEAPASRRATSALSRRRRDPQHAHAALLLTRSYRRKKMRFDLIGDKCNVASIFFANKRHACNPATASDHAHLIGIRHSRIDGKRQNPLREPFGDRAQPRPMSKALAIIAHEMHGAIMNIST